MLKSNLKIILVLVTLIVGMSNILAEDNIKQNQSGKTEIKIPLKTITPQDDEALSQFIKKINNPRIIYKNGQVIFYPNPNVETMQNKVILIAVLIFVCSITVILLPISFILLILEIFYSCDLSTRKDLARCLNPHIIADDYGIKIKKQKIFWTDIKNISKEEVTIYSDGWVSSRNEIFHFYDKHLNCLFNLDDQDKYIELSIDTLISVVYYFLEKSKTEFTQNVQKTTISNNTRYHPVYIYR